MIGGDLEGLEAIVSSSVRRNAQYEVTGILWADGKSFAQVLEGDPSNVGQTMGRIRTDHRHTDIEVLLDRPVRSRQFGSWSMHHATDDEASAHATAFMIGFAMGERADLAKRLYDIVLGSDGQRA